METKTKQDGFSPAKVTERVKAIVECSSTDELLSFIHNQKCINNMPYDLDKVIEYAEAYLVEYHVVLP